jgi:hypothetical protein
MSERWQRWSNFLVMRSQDFHPPDCYFWGHMKTMVYGEKTISRDALLHRLFDGAEQIRDKPDVLGRTTDSLIHGPQKCTDAEGTLFEHLYQ